jgi:hypothetical protein
MINEYVMHHCSRSEFPRILIRSAWQHDATESSLTPGLTFCSVYDVRHKTMPVIYYHDHFLSKLSETRAKHANSSAKPDFTLTDV